MTQDTDSLIRWLIGEGRLLGEAVPIVRGYCDRLLAMGVPLSRVRIGQSYANPLLSAWGIVWTPDRTKRYNVAAEVLETPAWQGSPFEHVVTTRRPVRQRLKGVDLSGAHPVYAELAQSGATDFLAMPLEYGDGTVQGSSFSTEAPEGFTEAQIRALRDSRNALASALEPVAMRESQKSLLRTYLGDGPAREIGQGRIKRGETRAVSAAILFADLRGYTARTDRLPETQVLSLLGEFFDLIVTEVQHQGGDILKFMGDGVLAMFEATPDPAEACNAALRASANALTAMRKRGTDAPDQLPFVIGLDFGQVTLGNIGSPDRLDFTVVGSTVNRASRVQGVCKDLGEHALVTAAVADHASEFDLHPIGAQDLRGLHQPVDLFRLPL